MRDQLAHHYFDTDHAIVTFVLRGELTPLRTAIVELARQTTTPDLALVIVATRLHLPVHRSERRVDFLGSGVVTIFTAALLLATGLGR
jgi:hypothetical protein